MDWINNILELFYNLEDKKLTTLSMAIAVIGIIVAVIQLLLPLINRLINKPKAVISRSEIYKDNFPTTDNSHFTGRKEIIDQLNEAWLDQDTNVFAIHAMGGMGKTALINKWLEPHEANNWIGIPKVYAWSFHNQGDTAGHKQSSSGTFIDHALAYFHNDNTALNNEYKKGQHLGKLIGKQPCLLILDGLEPFQYLSDDEENGTLRDEGLKGLLETLAQQNAGLCVITTRIPINNAFSRYPNIQYHELDALSEQECIEFLQKKEKTITVNDEKETIKIEGKQEEFENLVKHYQQHIFSIQLIANYLLDFCSGDIRQHDTLKVLEDTQSLDNGENQGDQAYAIMQAYEQKLKDTPALALLYVISVFDRPIEKEVIDELILIAIFKDKIGMNKFLLQLDNKEKWQEALNTLSNAKLLRFDKKQQRLDTHPLVRQYFRQNLQWHYPADWKRINAELYAYYKDLPEKQQPDTLEEMEPLFAAIAHGCAAGMHQQALDDVYWLRISRKNEHYLVRKIGAYGTELSSLSHFFSQHWHTPVTELSNENKAALLNWVAFYLRAFGRLQEAAQPMQASVDMFIKQENWKKAACAASSLSELQLTCGTVVNAITVAQQSVEFSDNNGDEFQQIRSRTTLGDAQSQAGERTNAQKFFEQAESLQKEWQAEYPQLYSLQGFQYCDLLLTAGQWQEVQQRAKQSLEWATRVEWLLDIALDQLSLARANLQQAISQAKNVPNNVGRISATPSAKLSHDTQVLAPFTDTLTADDASLFSLQTAENWLNQAVGGLRKAGAEEFIIRGLLARACYYRFCLALPPPSRSHRSRVGTETVARIEPSEIRGKPPALRKLHTDYVEKAIQDLQETHDIAQRGGMLLHLCDYHLESARLALSIDEPVFELTASEHTQKAKQLIDDTGYKRRLPEVEYLEALL